MLETLAQYELVAIMVEVYVLNSSSIHFIDTYWAHIVGAEKILIAEGRAVNTSDRAPAAARNKTEDEEECIKHHKLE